jgi:signal transduction histidine kinase
MANKKWVLVLFIFCCVNYCFSQSSSPIDSAKRRSALLLKEDEKVKNYFFIADEYMNVEQYDSAQIWLNKIHAILPVKGNSLSNYFLHTRQAEVYYYNNLQQLGLQESRKGLAMAQALNDSLLLADSYNFLGLFYMNIDSSAASLNYYKEGLRYCSQPPFPPQYLSLSKPHHLHGNLAEAFYNLKMYDSALIQYTLSLQKAKQINWGRGVAVAYYGLGDAFYAQQKNDSALTNYIAGVNAANISKDIDVALVCYSGMAKAHYLKKNNDNVNESLAMGFDLLKQYPNINRFYALIFLNSAIDIYKKQNNNVGLIKALELKSSIETANINGNNTQIQTILNAGLQNEKRVLSLEVQDAKQKQKLANTQLLLALIGIGLIGIIFLVYRYYQKQQLAVSKMRQKISMDLHDDIGASLSSLQIYGTIAEQTIETDAKKAVEMVKKMSSQSKEIMENMNDIVWSMKNSTSNNTSFEIKIKNYAVGLLSDATINFTYNILHSADAMITNITARKNILLIAKEAINNIAKYSKANNASLSLTIQNTMLILQIKDDGIGFEKDNTTGGNGLENMQQRTTELKGILELTTSKQNGTLIIVKIPISNIH